MTTRLLKRTMKMLSFRKRNKRSQLQRHMGYAPRDLDFDMEALENRQMLAGNVTAVLAGNNLTITGDGADNDISISQSGSQIMIEGLDDTNIIFGGESSSTHYIDLNSSSLNNLTIVMKGGDDSVDVSDVEVNGDFKAVGNGGNDSFTGNSLAIGGNINGKMGAGADYFSINESGVGGNVDVNLGGTPNDFEARPASGDSFEMRDTRVSGDVSVAQQSNRGSVYMSSTDIEGNLSVKSGRGSDSFSLYDSNISGDVSVNLGSSDSSYEERAPGGDRADFAFSGIDGDLTVKQTANQGYVGFYLANVDGDLTVQMGKGSDQVGGYGGVSRGDSSRLSVGGNATFELGSNKDGRDSLSLNSANIEGDLHVSQTSGDSFVRLSGDSYFGYYYGYNDVYVGGNLDVSTGSGDDQVVAYSYGRFGSYGSLTVDGHATIDLGSSDSNSYSDRIGGRGDYLALTSTQISGNLTVIQTGNSGEVFMGAANDSDGVSVDGDLNISMGSGDDWVGIYNYDRYYYLGGATALTVSGNAEIDLGSASSDGVDWLALSATDISGDLTIDQTDNRADIYLGGSNRYYYYSGTRGGDGSQGVYVGNDLNISTGSGSDRVDVRYSDYVNTRGPDGSGDALIVGGNATIDLGSATADDSDQLTLTATDISGDLTIGQTDNQAEINLGGYNNSYYYYYYPGNRSSDDARGVVVGNDLSISTGSGSDRVHAYYDNYYDNRDADASGHAIVVGGNATIDLGSSDGDGERRGRSGDSADLELVDVDGNLVIVQTENSGDIRLNTVYVYGDTIIETGSGNDFVDIDNDVDTRGFGGGTEMTLLVDMGSGDDGIDIYNMLLGETEIILGSGNDNAYLYNVNVLEDFFVDMGRDRDMMNLEDTQFSGNILCTGGHGFDSVDLNNVTMLGGDPVFDAIEKITGWDEPI